MNAENPASGGVDDAISDRVLTVPNALSLLRLIGVGVFLWLLVDAGSPAWALVVLLLSGVSDWADGKLARLLNQSSRLGALLDPAVDRLYMVAIPIGMALAGTVSWWPVVILIARDVLLFASGPVLRSRGLTALPVLYIGKAATFALMSAFPLILAGDVVSVVPRALHACGWALLIWGIGMYVWTLILYWVQTVMVILRVPRVVR